MSAFLFVLGLAVVTMTAVSVLFTLVLPRRPVGIERLTLVVNRTVRLVFVALSAWRGPTRARTPSSPHRSGGADHPAPGMGRHLDTRVRLMLTATTHAFGDGLLQSLTALFTVGRSTSAGRRTPGSTSPSAPSGW